MAKQKMSAADAIKLLQEQDPYMLRVIGREAGLATWQKLIAEETIASKKLLIEEAYAIELKIIDALKAKDEEKFVELELQGKAIFEQIKLISALSQ